MHAAVDIAQRQTQIHRPPLSTSHGRPGWEQDADHFEAASWNGPAHADQTV